MPEALGSRPGPTIDLCKIQAGLSLCPRKKTFITLKSSDQPTLSAEASEREEQAELAGRPVEGRGAHVLRATISI